MIRLNTDTTVLIPVPFMGRTLDIHQDPSSLNHGLCLWDAALCFLRYLEANPREAEALRGASVLELGAGTGVLGLALAHCLGCHVVCTDLPSVLPNLQANLAANPLPAGAAGAVLALDYAWDGSAPPHVLAASRSGAGFQHIIGTDVAYSETLNATLLATAAAFAGALPPAHGRAVVTLVNELRCEVAQAVFDRVAPQLFKVHRVPAKRLHPDFRGSTFIMARMTLKRGGRVEAEAGGGAGGGGGGREGDSAEE